MTITQTTAPATTDAAEWVGPCGCPVCEKWADCDWCSGCTPENPWDAQAAEEARVEALPFWEWMDERG